jgi:hypothetical protein
MIAHRFFSSGGERSLVVVLGCSAMTRIRTFPK